MKLIIILLVLLIVIYCFETHNELKLTSKLLFSNYNSLQKDSFIDGIHYRYNYNDDNHTIVIILHGYGSHCNTPAINYLNQSLITNNIGYVNIDFVGHGYSEGLKGYIDSPKTLISNVFIVINKILPPNKSFYIQGAFNGWRCCTLNSK